jgi:hypothetical protein
MLETSIDREARTFGRADDDLANVLFDFLSMVLFVFHSHG